MSRAGGARMTDFEERDYYPPPRRSAPNLDDYPPRRVQTQVRSRPVSEADRTPAFLREDRHSEAGPMVLRQRQVETIDRHRPRSPSPPRVQGSLVRRPRSISPNSSFDHEHERSRTRVLERERIRSPSVARERPPSPRPIRYVERPRRSPSPVVNEQDHIRIIEREREPERTPAPPPMPEPEPEPEPPTVIRGPIIEREVITHYRDIDHGVIKARQPSPPPPPRPQSRMRERETDIDISLTRDKTEVDIRRSVSTRGRSKSRERRSGFGDELVIRRDDRVRFEEPEQRRARSAAPPMSPPLDDEAEYITAKLDGRGKMGEAWNGATKDWTLVDVPPGTERIRMDGVGGASTNTSFTRYSGVRRTQFIPERDGDASPAPVPREPSPPPTRDRVNVSVWDREREIDIERTRSTSRAGPPQKDMWTEIAKDLVLREAILELGYEYEETPDFFYVMDYLKYDDVLRLVDISDEIRRARKDRVRDIEYEREREYRDEHDRSRHRHSGRGKWDDERWFDREWAYDSLPKGYLR